MKKVETQFNGYIIYDIGGYRVKISKRKYPTFTANFCTLDLEDREDDIILGDPVTDLRKKEVRQELKNRVKRYVITAKLGEKKMEELYDKFSFGEIFDYINNELKVDDNFVEKFRNKYVKGNKNKEMKLFN